MYGQSITNPTPNTMSRTRFLVVLILIIGSSISAFSPRNFLRTSTRTTTHPRTTLRARAAVSTTPPVKNGKQFSQFQWLNWVYCQWRSREPGELDEKLLKQMYPAILGWGRRKTQEGADRAEELLERIIEENLAGNEHAQVTVKLFNSAMDAHAKVGNPDGVQRILQRMQELRRGHESMKHLQPDVFSMSTLATAWAKTRSPLATQKAEAILDYMELNKMPPNTITYNAVLNAVAHGQEVDKALRVEDLVKRMKVRSEKGEDCKPDIYSYQSLIQAWSKTPLSGSPQKAEEVLLFLENEYEKGKTHLKPNSYCFTSTIHAWAKSREREKARKAYQIFNHMKRRYIQTKSKMLKPNVVVFTAVLNACAWPEDESEREDAFEIARLTMEELSLGTFDEPNFLSFAAFLSVCFSTLDPGEARDNIVRKTFQQCINRGEVAGIVLEKLSTAASPELYHELLNKYRDDTGKLVLPYRWNRNVKGERDLGSEIKKPVSIRRSSMLRLRQIEKYRGTSGAYSGTAKPRPESEGITWSTRGFDDSADNV